MIAQLVDTPGFSELKEFFDGMYESELRKLADKTVANPEGHDRIEWERLKARWHAIEQVLSLPEKVRNRKESQ